jgi:transcriptional regulator with XRE-family HTH domain
MGNYPRDTWGAIGQYPTMDVGWKIRLEQLLKERGLDMKTVSKGAGLGETYVRDILKRGREPGIDRLQAISAYLSVPFSWLVSPIFVPIVGFVRAGADEVIYENGQGPFGMAPSPPNATESTVAVVVRGGSMAGRADEGDLVYYDRRELTPTDDMIGRLCIIGLLDGRVVIKKLLRTDGTWVLHSTTADPIVVDAVAWAAPVAWIKPR